MKQIKYFYVLVLLAMMVCGCEPEMRQCLQSCSVEQVEEICVYQDGVKRRCAVGAEMREVLRGELETWKRAGLDGFDTSIDKFAPDVCLSFRNINSAPYTWLFKDLIEACVVNFTESVVVVNVIRRNGSTQYVRETTEVDKCFRRILLEMTMQSNNHAANFQLFDWSQGLGEDFRFRSNEDFAEFLKRGKGFVGTYVALRKGRYGKVFYVFVENLNRRQDIGEIARLSLHFDRVEDLEMFEQVYIRSGVQCRRINARALDPDPLGEYSYVDEGCDVEERNCEEKNE